MSAETFQLFDPANPHAQQLVKMGPPAGEAFGAMVLVHGRGATAQSMRWLYEAFRASDYLAVAPQAAGQSWYPHSFLSPISANQPYLDSALARLETLFRSLAEQGMPADKTVLAGFSQGACLALEYAARHPRRYGAIIGLSGGLIGPPGTPRRYPGLFAGTPVFLGGGDPDPHVPFERMEETAQVFRGMEAAVELRRYPGMGHGINEDELDAARQLVQRLGADGRSAASSLDPPGV